MILALFSLRTKETVGLEGLGDELVRETHKVGKSTLSKASTILASRMRKLLSSRAAPSQPGDPPARVEGALRDTIGKDRPRRAGDTITVKVGVGQGRAKARKVDYWKSQGINVYEYASLLEHGGRGAGHREYEARPFASRAEEETAAEIDALFESTLR